MYNPIFIAGPCVIETFDILEEVAKDLVRLNNKYGINIIFKSSFDKANRTSLHSYRGPNLEKGLTIQGISRSERKDFLKVVELLKNNPNLFDSLDKLISEVVTIKSLNDLKEAFDKDYISGFGKTILVWDK